MNLGLKNLLSIAIVVALISGCSFNKETPTSSSAAGKTTPNTPRPENNAVSQFLVLNFNWDGDSNAKFDFYLDKNNPPSIIYVKDVTSRPIFVTGLDYSTVYYWRVVAKYTDGVTVAGPIWKFTTLDKPTSGSSGINGYSMFLDSLNTALPNSVKALFQVKDLNGNGITDLKSADFEVYEDSQTLSPSESQIQINRKTPSPYTIKTVLLLDNSTSLQNNISDIRSAALSLVNSLVPNQEIAIYTFSEKLEQLVDFTSDKNDLYAALLGLSLGVESTNLYGSIKEAVTYWDEEFSADNIVQGNLVIISDGKDTQGSSKLADAMNAVHNKVVFTVGVGSELETEIMKQLGSAGYYPIANIDQLETQFYLIQQKIVDYTNSYYVLSYKSPKRGDGDHLLTITIIDNPHIGDNSFITGSFSSSGFYSP